MEWTVWVIKVYGITTGSWITVLREGKETFPPSSSQRFKISVSWDCAVVFCCAAHFPNGRWGFACETSSYAVSESNTKHRNEFEQRQGGILHINWNHPKAGCCVCSARGVRREVVFKCVKCDVALCADRNYFEDYHTNLMWFWPCIVVNMWK